MRNTHLTITVHSGSVLICSLRSLTYTKRIPGFHVKVGGSDVTTLTCTGFSGGYWSQLALLR